LVAGGAGWIYEDLKTVLRRSRRDRAWSLVQSRIVYRRWSSAALVAGPFLGALLIFATGAPLALLDIVAGVVYALAMPFVALTTAYVYFDARVRTELEPPPGPSELPAELELGRPQAELAQTASRALYRDPG